ncbi:helix-turn-helix transcriptional regulator [Streptomyces sp. NPDC005708]|uniref:helix-turn-helix domain-containing protein n=1 Tax=Streptomyces sp. NPDC005708 TaxID=3154564 RepID=UPI00340E9402
MVSGDDAADTFAQLLRELKERSGLSYGLLAKRLHMSTSTLHRYCNGDVVPTDYAPVERLARLCKASPEELVELHRRWVLADAMRERKNKAAAGSVREARPVEPGSQPGGTGEREPGGTGEPGPGSVVPEAGSAGSVERADAARPEPEAPARPGSRRRLRSTVLVPVGALAVLGAAALAWQPSFGLGGDDAKSPTGASSAVERHGTADEGGTGEPTAPSPSRSGKGAGKEADGKRSPGRATGSVAPSTRPPTAPADVSAVPLTVNTRPYAWEGPCSQHYLIDRPPQQIPPPPVEQDAPGWVSALGAVSSGEQYVVLTVQGTGASTVVLEDLRVRVISSDAPLAWSDYAMGVGCGGGVGTQAFGVDLDAGRPAAVPARGQRDFPFKVSESDPEVFRVLARTGAHDVRWYLELEWSSGSRHGTVRIDDHGKPFRTSGATGRPGFDFPLGGSQWYARDEG